METFLEIYSVVLKDFLHFLYCILPLKKFNLLLILGVLRMKIEA